MNVFNRISLLLAIVLIPGILAAGPWQLNNEIMLAMKSGNSKMLAKYFEANIELKIIDDEEIYSKTQAELILKDFFAKNKPSDFKTIHDGGEGVKYAIGNLTTDNGNYRVTIMYRVVGEKPVIKTIRIEEE
ncbi:MAG: DUF4783 domain-containing protein [Bacteroidales bacterium]|nr:DUF4783 domain-containing protein [Bacteroidales bacterium]